MAITQIGSHGHTSTGDPPISVDSNLAYEGVSMLVDYRGTSGYSSLVLLTRYKFKTFLKW